MLDEGMPSMPKAKKRIGKETLNAKLLLPFDDKDFMLPRVCEKILLVDRGRNPFDILPEGWIVVTHTSGMPLYLHKKSRVCTLSRPYFIGAGSVRRHDIPVSSIPCLQYKRALEEAANQNQDINNSTGNPNLENETTTTATITNNDNNSNMIPPSTIATSTNNSMSSNATTTSITTTTSAATATTSYNIGTCPKDFPPIPGLPHVSRKLKVQTFEEHKRTNSLDPLAFREYCQKLFEFRTITIRRFKRWKDRRKHNQILKNAGRPSLAPNTRLITCQLQNDKGAPHHNKKKEFVINPAGKSAVCILHEYAQHAIKVQPKYKFTELENSQTPYSATVIINEIHYGTGYASSKKLAKLEAARVTLDILIPDINKEINARAAATTAAATAFFDSIRIQDPRLLSLCATAGHPTPYQILHECLHRNYGMGDTDIKMEMKPLKRQRSEFIMKVGKHEAKVICKNKREGKQQASQAILQLLHPHIKNWGSLLRLYSKANEAQEKRAEEHSVTELQTRAQPNRAILSKLRREMNKLYNSRNLFESNATERIHVIGHQIRSAELGSVEL
ncbi:hypothetical protein HELRODRAFT_99418 [Helobdella robusta]|uniref:DRBM domain-containing protein n=1 Tax=Helobdella robusta TaxID=6412 RepID=T1G9S7_HELRO|nr:hypothetical protein HELRODRAFT_99418 [Helobdella robusta]ESO05107.1 hypothetical protein HELRODRAFT_99418 [Helobdella robusta]